MDLRAPILWAMTVALSLAVLVSCAGGSGVITSEPSAAVLTASLATRVPTQPLVTEAVVQPSPSIAPIRAGELSPGLHRTTNFDPTLTFVIQGDGWNALFADDADEVAIEGPGGFVAMTRVSQVVDPDTSRPVDAPADLFRWFADHPRLTAGTAQPVELGGLAGQAFEVTNESGSRVSTFAYPTGNLRVPDGTRTRYYVLELDGPDLVILIDARADGFDAFVERSQPVLDSLVVETP